MSFKVYFLLLCWTLTSTFVSKNHGFMTKSQSWSSQGGGFSSVDDMKSKFGEWPKGFSSWTLDNSDSSMDMGGFGGGGSFGAYSLSGGSMGSMSGKGSATGSSFTFQTKNGIGLNGNSGVMLKSGKWGNWGKQELIKLLKGGINWDGMDMYQLNGNQFGSSQVKPTGSVTIITIPSAMIWSSLGAMMSPQVGQSKLIKMLKGHFSSTGSDGLLSSFKVLDDESYKNNADFEKWELSGGPWTLDENQLDTMKWGKMKPMILNENTLKDINGDILLVWGGMGSMSTVRSTSYSMSPQTNLGSYSVKSSGVNGGNVGGISFGGTTMNGVSGTGSVTGNGFTFQTKNGIGLNGNSGVMLKSGKWGNWAKQELIKLLKGGINWDGMDMFEVSGNTFGGSQIKPSGSVTIITIPSAMIWSSLGAMMSPQVGQSKLIKMLKGHFSSTGSDGLLSSFNVLDDQSDKNNANFETWESSDEPWSLEEYNLDTTKWGKMKPMTLNENTLKDINGDILLIWGGMGSMSTVRSTSYSMSPQTNLGSYSVKSSGVNGGNVGGISFGGTTMNGVSGTGSLTGNGFTFQTKNGIGLNGNSGLMLKFGKWGDWAKQELLKLLRGGLKIEGMYMYYLDSSKFASSQGKSSGSVTVITIPSAIIWSRLGEMMSPQIGKSRLIKMLKGHFSSTGSDGLLSSFNVLDDQSDENNADFETWESSKEPWNLEKFNLDSTKWGKMNPLPLNEDNVNNIFGDILLIWGGMGTMSTVSSTSYSMSPETTVGGFSMQSTGVNGGDVNGIRSIKMSHTGSMNDQNDAVNGGSISFGSSSFKLKNEMEPNLDQLIMAGNVNEPLDTDVPNDTPVENELTEPTTEEELPAIDEPVVDNLEDANPENVPNMKLANNEPEEIEPLENTDDYPNPEAPSSVAEELPEPTTEKELPAIDEPVVDNLEDVNPENVPNMELANNEPDNIEPVENIDDYSNPDVPSPEVEEPTVVEELPAINEPVVDNLEDVNPENVPNMELSNNKPDDNKPIQNVDYYYNRDVPSSAVEEPTVEEELPAIDESVVDTLEDVKPENVANMELVNNEPDDVEPLETTDDAPSPVIEELREPTVGEELPTIDEPVDDNLENVNPENEPSMELVDNERKEIEPLENTDAYPNKEAPSPVAQELPEPTTEEELPALDELVGNNLPDVKPENEPNLELTNNEPQIQPLDYTYGNPNLDNTIPQSHGMVMNGQTNNLNGGKFTITSNTMNGIGGTGSLTGNSFTFQTNTGIGLNGNSGVMLKYGKWGNWAKQELMKLLQGGMKFQGMDMYQVNGNSFGASQVRPSGSVTIITIPSAMVWSPLGAMMSPLVGQSKLIKMLKGHFSSKGTDDLLSSFNVLDDQSDKNNANFETWELSDEPWNLNNFNLDATKWGKMNPLPLNQNTINDINGDILLIWGGMGSMSTFTTTSNSMSPQPTFGGFTVQSTGVNEGDVNGIRSIKFGQTGPMNALPGGYGVSGVSFGGTSMTGVGGTGNSFTFQTNNGIGLNGNSGVMFKSGKWGNWAKQELMKLLQGGMKFQGMDMYQVNGNSFGASQIRPSASVTIITIPSAMVWSSLGAMMSPQVGQSKLIKMLKGHFSSKGTDDLLSSFNVLDDQSDKNNANFETWELSDEPWNLNNFNLDATKWGKMNPLPLNQNAINDINGDILLIWGGMGSMSTFTTTSNSMSPQPTFGGFTVQSTGINGGDVNGIHSIKTSQTGPLKQLIGGYGVSGVSGVSGISGVSDISYGGTSMTGVGGTGNSFTFQTNNGIGLNGNSGVMLRSGKWGNWAKQELIKLLQGGMKFQGMDMYQVNGNSFGASQIRPSASVTIITIPSAMVWSSLGAMMSPQVGQSKLIKMLKTHFSSTGSSGLLSSFKVLDDQSANLETWENSKQPWNLNQFSLDATKWGQMKPLILNENTLRNIQGDILLIWGGMGSISSVTSHSISSMIPSVSSFVSGPYSQMNLGSHNIGAMGMNAGGLSIGGGGTGGLSVGGGGAGGNLKIVIKRRGRGGRRRNKRKRNGKGRRGRGNFKISTRMFH